MNCMHCNRHVAERARIVGERHMWLCVECADLFDQIRALPLGGVRGAPTTWRLVSPPCTCPKQCEIHWGEERESRAEAVA